MPASDGSVWMQDLSWTDIETYLEERNSPTAVVPIGSHGGEFETSFMLYRHPELVDEDEFIAETSERWTRFASDDFVGMDDSVLVASSKHDWDDEALGHHGDPTKASAEKGEKLYEAIVSNAVEFYEDLVKLRAKQSGEEDDSLGLTY